MMRRPSSAIARVLAGIALLAGAGLASCGGDDLTIGTGQPIALPTPRPTPSPTCGQAGDACDFDTDCCDRICTLGECQ